MIGCASSTPAEGHAARWCRVAQCPSPGTAKVCGPSSAASSTGPSRQSRNQARRSEPRSRSRPRSRRPSRLQGQLSGDLALSAQAADSLEHRRRPAGIDLSVSVAIELSLQQLGDQAAVTAAAIVGGHLRITQQLRAGCALGVAKAEQDRSVGTELVLPDGQRGDADSAPDQHRAPASRAGAKPWPRGPTTVRTLPRDELAQPAGSGTHVLEQEVQPSLRTLAGRAQDAEGAWQEGSLRRPSPPSLSGSEHVELAGPEDRGHRDQLRSTRCRHRGGGAR